MKNSVLTQAPRHGQAPPMLVGSGTRKLGGRDPIRALQRILSLLVVALFVSLFPSRAHAYSWMIKHGYSGCAVCHADPSGGELLTAYGRAQSELLLRMHYGHSKETVDSSGSGSSSSPEESKPAAAPATPDAADADSDDDDKPAGDASKTDANSGEDDAAPDAEKKADAPAGDQAAPTAEKATAAAKPAAEEKAPDDDSEAEAGNFLWGLVHTPDWLLLGGAYRQLAVYKPGGTAGSGAVVREGSFVTFPMMADVYGQAQFGGFRVEGSLGVIRVGVGSPYGRAAQITKGQGDQWNLLSRTHWIGYDFDEGRFTVRAGHLNLPYGIRIPEHTMWVRSATRTDRESAQQDGVAVAFNGEALRGEVMAIAGNYQINPDKYRERGYSGYAEYMVSPQTALGITSLVTHASEDRITLEPKVLRQAHGVMVRSALSEKLALLTEADVLASTYHETGYTAFAQLDLEATQGLHLMLTGEVVDAGYDSLHGNGIRSVGNGQPAFGGWGSIDWFCFSHVEVRADVLSRQGDDITALGQLHVFL